MLTKSFKRFSGSQAKVKELEDALALAATTLAQVKADAAAKKAALSAAAEEQAKLREENEVLTLSLQALKVTLFQQQQQQQQPKMTEKVSLQQGKRHGAGPAQREPK